DGIRDFHVTGVQTCALPIYRRRPVKRDLLHERCELRPRPGPLSEFAQRALVDLHDRYGRTPALAREEPLPEVEARFAPGDDRGRGGRDQPAQRGNGGGCAQPQPAQRSASRPSYAATTSGASPARVSSSGGRVSRSIRSIARSSLAGSWWKSARRLARAIW